MKVDNNISRSKSHANAKYDFSDVVAGSSVWVKGNTERVSLMDAFKRWSARNETRLVAVSQAVDSSDPRGAGIRVFFEERKEALKPTVLSRLTAWYANLDEIPEQRLAMTGLFSVDDVLTAASTADRTPATISEANDFIRELVAGKTAFQIEYSMRVHGKTFADTLEDHRRARQARDQGLDDKRADQAARLAQAKREEAAAMAELERELGERE